MFSVSIVAAQLNVMLMLCEPTVVYLVLSPLTCDCDEHVYLYTAVNTVLLKSFFLRPRLNIRLETCDHLHDVADTCITGLR